MDKANEIKAALFAAGYTSDQIVLVYPTSRDWRAYKYGIRVMQERVTFDQMDHMQTIANALLPDGQRAVAVWA
jgi:hypothetical protein